MNLEEAMTGFGIEIKYNQPRHDTNLRALVAESNKYSMRLDSWSIGSAESEEIESQSLDDDLKYAEISAWVRRFVGKVRNVYFRNFYRDQGSPSSDEEKMEVIKKFVKEKFGSTLGCPNPTSYSPHEKVGYRTKAVDAKEAQLRHLESNLIQRHYPWILG